jgi:hypothetical protein
MWLGHDGIAVGLRSIISKKEYLVQKLAILNLRLDTAVGATSRGMTRIIPKNIALADAWGVGGIGAGSIDQCFWDRGGVNQRSTPLPIKLKSLMLRRLIVSPGKRDIAAPAPTISVSASRPDIRKS